MTKLGIITALPIEAKILTPKHLSLKTVIHLDKNILLSVAGMGAANAAAAANKLLQQGCDALISFGLAGSLDPQLNSGDLILPENVVNTEGKQIAVTQIWRKMLLNTLENKIPYKNGSLLQANDIVTTVEDKQQLFTKHQTNAVDMESFAIATQAQQSGKDFIIIRAVTDPANINLPASVINSLDTNGEVQYKKLLFNLLRKPSELPSLLRMAKYFSAAQNTLRDVIHLTGLRFGLE